MRKGNCLIITSSAGGGLLQAAIAQKQALLLENPERKITERDLLKDWVWGPLGNFSIESWNRAQKKGNVRAQTFFIRFQRVFEYITMPCVFFYTLKTLLKEDIDQVIDTQPTSTSTIIRAIRVFNWYRSKDLILEKLVVDLPTKKATHFFNPIRSLSKRDKKRLRVRTIKPLLENGETGNDFWEKHCCLPESKIQYEDVNVRLPFKQCIGKPRPTEEIVLQFLIKNDEEKGLLQEAINLGSVKGEIKDKVLHQKIPADATVISILLGSQPAKVATKTYVLNFISLAKKHEMKRKHLLLFVFCADHKEGETDSLLNEMITLLKRESPLSPFITVIPFSFQSCDVIAPLFHRSSITCTRSGGGTAMELMAVSTGEVWIHSETKSETPSLNEILRGIPVWESENAFFLVKRMNAKIVTPKTFIDRAISLLTL